MISTANRFPGTAVFSSRETKFIALPAQVCITPLQFGNKQRLRFSQKHRSVIHILSSDRLFWLGFRSPSDSYHQVVRLNIGLPWFSKLVFVNSYSKELLFFRIEIL